MSNPSSKPHKPAPDAAEHHDFASEAVNPADPWNPDGLPAYHSPVPPFTWHPLRPLGRNVLPGDVLHFGQVLSIEADPSRNTVSCGYQLDGVTLFTNIAGDRRIDVQRAIPVPPIVS